jgi:hypothetical protein
MKPESIVRPLRGIEATASKETRKALHMAKARVKAKADLKQVPARRHAPEGPAPLGMRRDRQGDSVVLLRSESR